MVFELAGRLRYHALWAYTALAAVGLFLDKIPVNNLTEFVALLTPVAFVITADVIKNRNIVSE
jgi:hypothetical protein